MSEADSRTGDPTPSLIGLLSRLQGALAVVGLFLYGALYIAYAYFYNRLGLRPEDVGLGYATAIIRSSGLMVLLVVLTAVFLFVFVRRRRSTLGRTSESMVNLLLPVTVKPDETPTSDDKPGEPSVIVVSASLKPGESPTDPTKPPTTRAFDLTDWIVKLAVGLVLVFLSSILAQVARLPHAVTSRADAVEAGKPVSPLRVGPLTVLDITAQRARISWIDTAPSGNDLGSRELLYLGQANSQLVLYDHTASEPVIRLPASSIILSVDG